MHEYKILVVDDEQEITSNLNKQLTEQGFQVKIARNFTEGDFMIRHHPFDIAIIDLFLPDGNGIDLFRSIKRENDEIYTIVITGHATIESAITALNEGVNTYLVKPFSNEQLKTSLQQAEKTLSLRAENLALFQEIQHNRQFYENLLNSTSEAILVVDLDYQIHYYNEAAKRIIHIENGQAENQGLHEYIEDGYKVLSHIYQQLVLGKPVAGYRVSITPKDKKSFDAHLSADFLHDKNDKIEGLIINLTNPLIHDEVFNRMLRKEKLSTIVNLANILSHEIRNPINILSGRLQLLATEKEDQNFTNSIHTIERQIDRVLNITELLNKFNLRREDSIPELCNVTKIFQEILKEKEKQIESKKIQLKVSLANPQYFIEGNESQFLDAFRYLFDAIIELVPIKKQCEIIGKISKHYPQSLWYDLQFKIPHTKINTEQLFNPYQSIDMEMNGLVSLGMTIMYIIFNNYGAKIESFNQNEDRTLIRIQFPLKSEKLLKSAQ